MPTTTAPDDTAGERESDRPTIEVCETCPGKRTFIESDNTDGWIATDHVVDVRR
jgi:hypothetical protein